jgi:hypothetical protein
VGPEKGIRPDALQIEEGQDKLDGLIGFIFHKMDTGEEDCGLGPCTAGFGMR